MSTCGWKGSRPEYAYRINITPMLSVRSREMPNCWARFWRSNRTGPCNDDTIGQMQHPPMEPAMSRQFSRSACLALLFGLIGLGSQAAEASNFGANVNVRTQNVPQTTLCRRTNAASERSALRRGAGTVQRRSLWAGIAIPSACVRQGYPVRWNGQQFGEYQTEIAIAVSRPQRDNLAIATPGSLPCRRKAQRQGFMTGSRGVASSVFKLA